MPQLPEEIVKAEIVDYLKTNHIWHFVYPANVTYGIPDIVAIRYGMFIGIEVKRADGKGHATALQLAVVDSIRKEGGVAEVVSTLTEVENMFKALRLRLGKD